MRETPVTPEFLANSVIAVPPLARDANSKICSSENQKIIRHLESGGVSTLLYGGNAILYHVALSEYTGLLEMLQENAGETTMVIPSVGPAYGLMMDQARILREFSFPTAMILPQRDLCTPDGLATAVRNFVDVFGRPAVLYIKHDNWIDVPTVAKLMNDGCLSWIKYAIVRDDPTNDDFLEELCQEVTPAQIVSGIGEQPAIAHLQSFGLGSFTSGCVCVAPRLSMTMLEALKAGRLPEAEQIREQFAELEGLRNSINPIRVLHRALSLAGIAETGPITPLLSELPPETISEVESAARKLLGLEQS
ncbi:dihydrodipicolinate synthase family protein [Thalassoroseus pseudoceratinae]|uniref:dihydrodipicolinate synthase family protein n=1 Tax=Thalassoroseus pseudoceratinae TaxID=2713176 RepID=UPI00142022A3|nr:dihydrodipicolinate synthase family protein [Thalassoroseus pseudoceratinae]